MDDVRTAGVIGHPEEVSQLAFKPSPIRERLVRRQDQMHVGDIDWGVREAGVD